MCVYFIYIHINITHVYIYLYIYAAFKLSYAPHRGSPKLPEIFDTRPK